MYMATMCAFTHKTRCILPAGLRCTYTSARCTYTSAGACEPAAYCLRIGCILPAEAMHISLAVLRDLMGCIAVLRSVLSRFQSFMLTFFGFYGKLHAKITRLSTLYKTQNQYSIYSEYIQIDNPQKHAA